MSIKSKSLIITVAIVAMLGGYWLSSMIQNNNDLNTQSSKERELAEARANYSPIQGNLLSPARKIIVPSLIKDNGNTFTIDDLTGKWHFLFFGYTHCPDVCPITMGVLAQAKKIATVNNYMFPDVVFVSVDPERDKVEMLTEYVQYFDKDFIGVTGDEKLIKAFTLQMSVVYLKVQEEGSSTNSYLVDHSAALLLLNPEGKLVAYFNPPHNAQTILKDFQTMVNLGN
ncbi:MAG: SCO family protein [Gammaproteobacteria bacterium]|nr:MAG: SCO family protein [Gammaproteobacteria bacterium]